MSFAAHKNISIGPQQLAYDALGHKRLASSVLTYLQTLPVGAVIAIQGSWGRGKTDVLARIINQLANERSAHARPVWLNPWQYGTADLITPIVRELVGRIPPEKRKKSDRLRIAAKTLLRAGNAMVFKTVSVAVPFGQVLSAGESAVDGAINELFDGPASSTPGDSDPVATMAQRFRDLVTEYLALTGASEQLVVCVDDLDRCLPDHQIAMLEAIHFLTSAHANCAFVVAIDPILVRQAANTHYKTAGFDSGRYLDKLFDLQITLPALVSDTITPLVQAMIEHDPRLAPVVDFTQSIQSALGVSQDLLVDRLARVMSLPELTNPRLLLRVIARIRLLVDELRRVDDSRLVGEDNVVPLLVWMVVAERWPQLREILQASDHDRWMGNLQLIGHYYGVAEMEGYSEQEAQEALIRHANITVRAPPKDQSPDLGSFLYRSVLVDEALATPDKLQHCELVVSEYGM
jgi:hypothetical protein